MAASNMQATLCMPVDFMMPPRVFFPRMCALCLCRARRKSAEREFFFVERPSHQKSSHDGDDEAKPHAMSPWLLN